MRWLLAEPVRVVDITWRVVERGPASPAVTLGDGLARWGARIGRARVIAATRRWALVALTLAIALSALGAATAPALIAPGVVFVLGSGIALRERSPLPAVARLLDERLGLAERLATAWELVTRGDARAGSPAGDLLAAQVVNEAEASLAQSLRTARVQTRSAPREWIALLALATAASALVLVGSPAREPARAVPLKRHAQNTPAHQQTVAQRPRERRAAAGSSLYSNNPYASPYLKSLVARLRGRQHISYTSPGLTPAVVNAGGEPLSRTPSSGGSAGGAQGPSSGTLGSSASRAARSAVGATGGQQAIRPVSKAPGAVSGGIPGSGSSTSPGRVAPRQAAGGPGSRVPAAPEARGGSSPSSSATGGTPTGGGGAGHQRGTDAAALAAARLFANGSVGLQLQGQYAPGASGGGAKPGQLGSGGGGRSRTQRVAAGGTADGPFGYIPSAASPFGRGQADLLLAYLHELSVLAGPSR